MTRLIQIACVSLILLALDAAVAQTAKIDPAWVYVSQPLNWENPPETLHLEIKTSAAEIIVVYPSGQLAMVACSLIQQHNGKITISKGDREVISSGSWTNDGDSLILTSHVVFRTFRLINSKTGKPVAEPEVIKVLNKQHDSLQDDKKRLFTHLKTFDDIEFLSLLANEREIENDGKPN